MQTRRTTLKRQPGRGAYDAETVHAILDEGLVCHLGFVVDDQPFVIPTIHARAGDVVYLHGAVANRALGMLREGAPCCLTVTLLDGLVLARSAFHHSMNYRSVVVLGQATEVESEAERRGAFEAFVEKVMRGRNARCRAPNEAELRRTSVLRLPLAEASAKVRRGPPIDEESDYALEHWAGVIPLRLVAGPPLPDARLPGETPFPHDLARDCRGAVPSD